MKHRPFLGSPVKQGYLTFELLQVVLVFNAHHAIFNMSMFSRGREAATEMMNRMIIDEGEQCRNIGNLTISELSLKMSVLLLNANVSSEFDSAFNCHALLINLE
jgi:hypothetical protein